ncbi:hypothetical protein [Streptomyces spectabilis]|nr:hypothetical protein [Streptomyces spectabilis]
MRLHADDPQGLVEALRRPRRPGGEPGTGCPVTAPPDARDLVTRE